MDSLPATLAAPSPTAPSNTTRRQALALGAAALAVPALLGTSAASASARPTRDSVPLPDGLQPEGITSGPGTRYFVGSLNDGRIVTGNLLRGKPSVLLAGAAGRQIRGLRYDPRTDLVWAAGNVGTTGYVWAVGAANGAVRHAFEVPGAVFLNDVDVTARAVWVTDSRVDRLTSIALTPSGAVARDAVPVFTPLGGDWPTGDGTAVNANGIRALSDGTLLLNNSAVGGLHQVDPTTGVSTPLTIHGGTLTGGDGLELHGNVVYDVRGSGQAEVSVLRLKPGAEGWSATWLGALTGALDVPSTATYAAGSVWAVNARFGVESPATATYALTRLDPRPS